VTRPAGDGQPDTTAHIESFSEVSELEVEATAGGARVRLKGPGSPAQLVRLVFPPLVCLTGFGAAAALLVADQPFWQAAVLFLVAQLVALVWWKIAAKCASPN
jgi:hypothetical protein